MENCFRKWVMSDTCLQCSGAMNILPKTCILLLVANYPGIAIGCSDRAHASYSYYMHAAKIT